MTHWTHNLEDQQTEKTFPALEDEVTPKSGDKYIQASIMIPRGNTFTCGTVVSCKRNAEGNIIGHAHDNLILESCIYDVDFADGKVTALTANFITKAMYAQCEPDGNKYIILDELIDIMSTADSLTLDQQKITFNDITCQCKSTKVGSFAADGRMALPPGKSCLTSKSPIQSKLMSLQFKWALHLNPVSTGGCSGSSRREMLSFHS